MGAKIVWFLVDGGYMGMVEHVMDMGFTWSWLSRRRRDICIWDGLNCIVIEISICRSVVLADMAICGRFMVGPICPWDGDIRFHF